MDPQFDKNLIWTGIIYFIGLYLLQVVWWKALIVAVAMMVSWYLTYGRRITVSVGLYRLFARLEQLVRAAADLVGSGPLSGHAASRSPIKPSASRACSSGADASPDTARVSAMGLYANLIHSPERLATLALRNCRSCRKLLRFVSTLRVGGLVVKSRVPAG